MPSVCVPAKPRFKQALVGPEYPPGRVQSDREKPRWLLLGSGVVNSSRNQAGDKRAEQGFAASARVVHELEEAEIEQ